MSTKSEITRLMQENRAAFAKAAVERQRLVEQIKVESGKASYVRVDITERTLPQASTRNVCITEARR